MSRGAPEERPRYLKEFLKWAAKFDDLCSGDRLVLCALFGYLGKNDSCWPTQKMLAEHTGLCTKQVKRILGKLASKKIIKCTKRNRGKNTNEYQFVFEQSGQTKGDIDVPFKGDADVPSKGTQVSPAKGTSRVSKTPEMQASRRPAGAEYIKNRSKNKSVNQSGTDGLTDEKTSDKKPASEEVVSLSWDDSNSSLGEEVNDVFAPRPGAPPRLAPEQINALFGGPGPRPVNLLNCPVGDFALRDLTSPFKKGPGVIEILGFDPDTPQAQWFEDALKEFYREVINRHWNPNADHPPGAPFRRLFYRAGRSGLLYEFGFRPLSPEQQEAQQREAERQEEEAAEAARLREEERRRLAEKEAEYKAFIKRRVVQNYLSCMGIPPRDYKNHLREIAARLNGRATLNAVEQFMRAKLQNEGH